MHAYKSRTPDLLSSWLTKNHRAIEHEVMFSCDVNNMQYDFRNNPQPLVFSFGTHPRHGYFNTVHSVKIAMRRVIIRISAAMIIIKNVLSCRTKQNNYFETMTAESRVIYNFYRQKTTITQRSIMPSR